MTRLVILGPPGAGKGTQAMQLAARLKIPTISTGDIFRANMNAGTELGKLAQRYMTAGEYVPDEVTNEMVRSRLAEDDAATGFLLDGYPRTVDQVEELDRMLEDQGRSLNAVIELTVDLEEVVQRLLKRALTENRPDDTEDVIRRRLEVYAEQTAPLTAIYEKRGVLRRVNGLGPIGTVTDRLVEALDVPAVRD